MSRFEREELTPREREVICHLAAGRSTGEVAALMGLAEPTIRSHVRAAMTELGASSRAQAVALAAAGANGHAASRALGDGERRLLAELAAGKTVSAAARSLHISRRTAHRWLEHARQVLGAESNLQVIVLSYGRQHGAD